VSSVKLSGKADESLDVSLELAAVAFDVVAGTTVTVPTNGIVIVLAAPLD
jgi:hypothetical protein